MKGVIIDIMMEEREKKKTFIKKHYLLLVGVLVVALVLMLSIKEWGIDAVWNNVLNAPLIVGFGTLVVIYFSTTRPVQKIGGLLHSFINHFNEKFPEQYFLYPPAFYQNSPKQLTDRGKEIADESGTTRHIDEHINEYSKELDLYKEDVDVFDRCKEIADRVFGAKDEQSLPIRKYIYNTGIYENIIKEIFAIKLRDVYLAHKKKKAI